MYQFYTLYDRYIPVYTSRLSHFAAISLRGNLTSRQSRTSVAYSVSFCFRTREIAPTFPAQSRTSSDRCEAEKSFKLLARRRKGRNWLIVSVASSKRTIEKRHYRKTTSNTYSEKYRKFSGLKKIENSTPFSCEKTIPDCVSRNLGIESSAPHGN